MFFRLSLGNLRNGANAGLWYVNGNNGTANARWNIGSRQSGWLSHASIDNYFRRDYPPLWRERAYLAQPSEIALRPPGQ